MWSHQNGPAACTINNSGGPCFTTSSPAIDPNRLYVYSYGLDGLVHKYHVGDGVEVTGGGWPQLATLKGFDEKGSAALSFARTCPESKARSIKKQPRMAFNSAAASLRELVHLLISYLEL